MDRSGDFVNIYNSIECAVLDFVTTLDQYLVGRFDDCVNTLDQYLVGRFGDFVNILQQY